MSNKKSKPRYSEEVKKLREERKEKRKKFKDATKEERKKQLEEYYDTQTNLRRVIEKEEREKVQTTIRTITQQRDPRNLIWDLGKKIRRKQREEYDTITEDGRTITDSQEAMEHVADYYERLYTARQAKEGMEGWTQHIQNQNKRTMEELEKKENPPDICIEEMKKAKRKLKKKKANGPDDIPNEIFTEATDETLEVYKSILNKTVHNKKIPEEWKEGEIISIYKGKGRKGICSNERGITLSSNFGKMYERIINDRLQREITISEAQGGGRKKVRTADHIAALHTAASINRNSYITFLDVTKAYDKAWADGLLYAIHKQGSTSKTWKTVKMLNENLTARVRTKHGPTRKIVIKDSIRQGGVLAVTLYATVMDEIAKEIEQHNLGITLPGGKKIGCLLWMDDVVLIAATAEEMHKMIKITGEVADRYHIEFGREKSKVMKIGNLTETQDFKMGDMPIEYCEKYKYLGITLNKKINMKDHIEEVQRKTEAAYQTIMSITGSPDFKGIEMQAIWQLVESCIIPIMTYGTEACPITKSEMKRMNSMLEAIIKKILMVPISTPREPLYYETGLLDVEHTIMKNKMNYLRCLKASNNTIIRAILQADSKWKKEIEEKRRQLQIEDTHKQGIIKRKIKMNFEKALKIQGENKSKTKYYTENSTSQTLWKRKKYMTKGTRHTAQNIFMARTRMIEVKHNYKAKYMNLNCRFCAEEPETQAHILEECMQINRQEYPVVSTAEIFEETNETQMKTTADKISKIRQLLKTSAAPTDQNLSVEAPS